MPMQNHLTSDKWAWKGGLLGLLVGSLALTASAQSIVFDDVSARAGLATDDSGHGVAVHDFDGDGWDDVFITVSKGTSALFRNNRDGTFTDVAAEAGVAVVGSYNTALWGDVDNDGLVDLFLAQGASGGTKLFLNDGNGTFTDVTATSGLDPEAHIATAAFGDVDGDGALDLFVAVDRAPDVLYRNTNGAGTTIFEDVSDPAGIDGLAESVAMQATWVDYDHDGDQDLFCVHDSRTLSRLYQNYGFLPLIDVAVSARIHTYPTETTCCNMGIAWGDFDGDGWQDAYVTRIARGGLYHNNGDGTFTDVAEERGALRNGMSWGVVFSDFDNDGDPDLFIVSTSGYDGTPTLLYRNDAGMFTEIGAEAGASFIMEAQGLAAGDFNNDGRPDLVIPSHDGQNKLLLNATEEAGHWVEIVLQGQQVNRTALGARVEVVAGGAVQVRTVSGGDSFASQSSPRLHVGLGAATQIDTLRIYWGGDAVQEVTGLKADNAYVIAEGVTSTDREPAAVPERVRLEANYPNPFNPATTIRYALAQAGPVRLDVFDALGRRVATLAEGFQTPGPHEVVFDARHLPSGPYLYRLHTADGIVMRRMLLIK